MSLTRRRFIRASAAAATSVWTASSFAASGAGTAILPDATASRLPRWRGFNLLEKFVAHESRPNPAFRASDFELVSEWGFNFVRLPMSYRCWAPGDVEQWLKFDEAQLKEVDAAIELGRRHGVHVNLNLHRAPGYCVNPPAEPLSLWKDAQALDACASHWAMLAKRYQGRPNREVSFDLLNEPPDIPASDYERVVRSLVQAIRSVDPDRLIIADGLKWGREPMPQLVDLRIAQSTRGYDPFRLTHYRAGWVKGSDKWDPPSWPMQEGGKTWDKDRLLRERIQPWKELEAKGVGIHVGEWGAFQHTPHTVTLAWMKEVLELWRDAGWGWAMWNLRGSFGPIDSGRNDVAYEQRHGLKIDRAMLDLIRAH